MAEVSRKWVTVMDAKAGFISALNAAMLTFLWSGTKFLDQKGWPLWMALFATGLSAISLGYSMRCVLPRTTLSEAMKKPMKYQNNFKPVSFFGYVAENYPDGKLGDFQNDILNLDENALAKEALEQHYTISHLVQQKSDAVCRAGRVWLVALGICTVAMILR